MGAMGAMAGYGLKAYLVCQSLNHIVRAYGRDNVILDNCHIVTSFAAADTETAKRIADMAGEAWEMRPQLSEQRPRAVLGARKGTVTFREERRPLLTALATGLHAPAIEQVQAALRVPPAQGDLWKSWHHAELGLVLAQHLQRLGRIAEAREALQAAVGGYEAVSVSIRDMLLEQRLAQARLLLGGLLLRDTSGRDVARGEQLLASAEQWYRGAGPSYAWRLVEVAAAHQGRSGP